MMEWLKKRPWSWVIVLSLFVLGFQGAALWTAISAGR